MAGMSGDRFNGFDVETVETVTVNSPPIATALKCGVNEDLKLPQCVRLARP